MGADLYISFENFSIGINLVKYVFSEILHCTVLHMFVNDCISCGLLIYSYPEMRVLGKMGSMHSLAQMMGGSGDKALSGIKC